MREGDHPSTPERTSKRSPTAAVSGIPWTGRTPAHVVYLVLGHSPEASAETPQNIHLTCTTETYHSLGQHHRIVTKGPENHPSEIRASTPSATRAVAMTIVTIRWRLLFEGFYVVEVLPFGCHHTATSWSTPALSTWLRRKQE